jgi:TIR domain
MPDKDQVQIFISYARRDDTGMGKARSKGFVTALHEGIEHILVKQGYPAPYLWRDKQQIEKAEYFNPKIEEAIKVSQLLVVVLSRNWVKRPNCIRELDLFRHRWGDVKERIIVVRRNLVDEVDCPEILRGTEGFRYFRFDGPNQEAGYETYIDDGGEVQDDFDAETNELGRYLWRAAKRRRALASGFKTEILSPSGRTVYLAKPAPDMTGPYEFLANNLVSQGFKVVPPQDQIIPLDSSAQGFVDNAMAQADTSIHLLGDESGYAPSGGHDAIVKMQLARASVRASDNTENNASPPFKRIIWAPKVLEDGSATEFRDPVAVVARFGPLIDGDKVLGDGRSGFWGSLKQLLDRKLHIVVGESIKSSNSDSRIYIYHKKEDRDFAVSIAEVLKEKDANIVLPPLQGTDAERAQLHKEYLRDCDTVVLCWAQATDVWAKMSLNELRNWRNLGRTDKFRLRSLVLGPPPGESKAPVALPPKSDYDCLLNFINEERPNPDSLGKLLDGGQPDRA